MDRAEFLAGAARGRVLDVGFNPLDRTLHEMIAEKAGRKNVTAIDTVIEKYEYGAAKADAASMPFRAGSFDSVIAGELVEHLEEPEKFFRECRRVLKKRGLLALSTPNRESWVNRIFHSYEAPLHFSLYSPAELKAELEKHSFEVKELKMFPYTRESSEGSRHRWFFPVRRLAHFFLPDSLRENIALVAGKVSR